MDCGYCGGNCIKKGIRAAKQRYQCKECLKYQLQDYERERISDYKIELIKNLNKEGVGISSISRLLKISKSSVQRKLEIYCKNVTKTLYNETNQSYEIDELRTYVGNKKNECWMHV